MSEQVNGRMNGSVLDFYNARIAADIGKEEIAVSGTLQEEEKVCYEKALISKEVFKVVFSSCNTKGDYEKIDGDKIVILEDEEIRVFGKVNNIKEQTILLNIPVDVRVKSIEGNKVYLVPAAKTEKRIENDIRDLINGEISRALDAGRYPVVWGRIERVEQNRLLVNILDSGILGFLHKAVWRKQYTRSLVGICKVGDYYQFEVRHQAVKKKNNMSKAWILSRKNLAEEPWIEADVGSIEPGSLMVVTCTEKPQGKTYWWGVSDRVPGLEIMGDFTDVYSDKNGMFCGLSYKCRVLKVTKNEKNSGYNIKVRPLRVVDEDVEDFTAMRRVKGNKK